MINKKELSDYIDGLPMSWAEEENQVGVLPIYRSYLAELPLTTLVVHNYNSEDGSEWILYSDGESFGFFTSSVKAMSRGEAIYKHRLKMSLGIEVSEEGGEG